MLHLHVHNAKDIDLLMLMYNLWKHCKGYSKTPESLCKYCCRDNTLPNNTLVDP